MFERVFRSPLTKGTINGLIDLQSFQIVTTPFGVKNRQVSLVVKGFTFRTIIDNPPPSIQPICERPRVVLFLSAYKKLRSGVDDEDDDESDDTDDEADNEDLVEIDEHVWTQSQSRDPGRDRSQLAPVPSPKQVASNAIQQDRIHVSTPSKGINLNPPIPASLSQASPHLSHITPHPSSAMRVAPSTQDRGQALLGLFAKEQPRSSMNADLARMLDALNKPEQQPSVVASQTRTIPAHVHVNTLCGESPYLAEVLTTMDGVEASVTDFQQGNQNAVVDLNTPEPRDSRPETQSSVDNMMTQALFARHIGAGDVESAVPQSPNGESATTDINIQDVTMVDAIDENPGGAPTSAQPDQHRKLDGDLEMDDVHDLDMGNDTGLHTGDENDMGEQDGLTQASSLPIDESLIEREPSMAYLRYARLNLPENQDSLLQRRDAWLPSVPGKQFPHPNVPLTILNELEDAAKGYDSRHSTVAASIRDMSSEPDSSAPLPGWFSSPPAQPSRFSKALFPPDSSVAAVLPVQEDISIRSSPPLSDSSDDVLDDPDEDFQEDGTPEHAVTSKLTEGSPTSPANVSLFDQTPHEACHRPANASHLSPTSLARQDISNDFVSASFTSSSTSHSSRHSPSPTRSLRQIREFMESTPPQRHSPRIEVEETPVKVASSTTGLQSLSGIPSSGKKRQHSPPKIDHKKKSKRSHQVNWSSEDEQPLVNPQDAYRQKKREYFNKERASLGAPPVATKDPSSPRTLRSPAAVTASRGIDASVPPSDCETISPTPLLQQHTGSSTPSWSEKMPRREGRNHSPDTPLESQTRKMQKASNTALKISQFSAREMNANKERFWGNKNDQNKQWTSKDVSMSTRYKNHALVPKDRAHVPETLATPSPKVLAGSQRASKTQSTPIARDPHSSLDQLYEDFRRHYQEYNGSLRHFENTCKMLLAAAPAVFPAQWDNFVVERDQVYKRYVERSEEDGEPHLAYDQYWFKHLQNKLATPRILPMLHTRLLTDVLGISKASQPAMNATSLPRKSVPTSSEPHRPATTVPSMSVERPGPISAAVSSVDQKGSYLPSLDRARVEELAALKEPARTSLWVREYYEPHAGSFLTHKELWAAHQAAFQKSDGKLKPRDVINLIVAGSRHYINGSTEDEHGVKMFRISGIRPRNRQSVSTVANTGKAGISSLPSETVNGDTRTRAPIPQQNRSAPPKVSRAMRDVDYMPEYRPSGQFRPPQLTSSKRQQALHGSDMQPREEKQRAIPTGPRRSLPWSSSPREMPVRQPRPATGTPRSEHQLPQRPNFGLQSRGSRLQTEPWPKDTQDKPSTTDSRKV